MIDGDVVGAREIALAAVAGGADLLAFVEQGWCRAGTLVAAGQLLAHPHTRRHWREELSVPSSLVDRDSYGDWVAAGARTALERAAGEVERRLATAAPPLDSDLAAELAGIVAAEARRFGVQRLPAV